MSNDLNFLISVIRRLESAGIRAWVFGGWAEELRGIRLPRVHQDVDLLFQADHFQSVDRFLAGSNGVAEVRAKRFSHKRAFVWEGVLIEILLVQNQELKLFTDFFTGSFEFLWPENTFACPFSGLDDHLLVASIEALQAYRQVHPKIEFAYATFLKQ